MKRNQTSLTGTTQSRFKTAFPAAALAVLAAGLMAGCSSAKVTGRQNLSAALAGKPTVVYVSDFDLQAENIHKSGSLLTPTGRSGPVRDFLLEQSSDPQELANKLVSLMADSIVKDLTKDNITAVRLRAGTPMPTSGWLIRGIFTDVQQGNRLRRTIIGFGAGKTDLQVVTTTDNLTNGTPQPFYQIETEAESGRLPGAAPMIVLSPYSVPIRFIMSRGDLEKNVKKTAAKIASEATEKIRGAE